jgi:hypothetical protein
MFVRKIGEQYSIKFNRPRLKFNVENKKLKIIFQE